MKIKTTTEVEFEAKRETTASGNKEYWTFRLVSNRYLPKSCVEMFCSMHGCGGQDMTFTENKTLLGYVYEGTATCYCD